MRRRGFSKASELKALADLFPAALTARLPGAVESGISPRGHGMNEDRDRRWRLALGHADQRLRKC